MENEKNRDAKMDATQPSPKTDCRQFLRRSLVRDAGITAVSAASHLSFNIRTAKAETRTWRIQTSWPGGIGLQVFKDWCNSIVEKTGGELAFKPFGAKDIVGDFQLFDAVKNGVIEAMNPLPCTGPIACLPRYS